MKILIFYKVIGVRYGSDRAYSLSTMEFLYFIFFFMPMLDQLNDDKGYTHNWTYNKTNQS